LISGGTCGMGDNWADNLGGREPGWQIEEITPIEDEPPVCKNCGEQLTKEAMACPICGEPNEHFSKPSAGVPVPEPQGKPKKHSLLYDTGAAIGEVAEAAVDIASIFGQGI
jgi:predicted amidophosphoribosyltransferase